MDNAEQVSQSSFAKFSAGAYYLKAVITKHCIVSCFMKSVPQIKVLSANSLRIIHRVFINHLKIQNKLQAGIDFQQSL